MRDGPESIAHFEWQAAKALAKSGRNVHFRKAVGNTPGGKKGVPTNDFIVGGTSSIGKKGKVIHTDGIHYELYTPTGGNIDKIVQRTAAKTAQAKKIVLDLTRTPLDSKSFTNFIDKVNDRMKRVHESGRTLGEIIIIRNGEIVNSI